MRTKMTIWTCSETLKKRNIAPDNDNTVTIRLPSSLKEIFEDESDEDLRNAIKQTRYANEMSLTGDKLHINAPAMKGLFSEAIQSTVSHVKELMKERVVSGVSSILMVGGFSESKMLQHAVRSNFPNVKVIIPQEADLVVLKGAVVFGHSPSSIAQRVCKYTYGIRIATPFDNEKHDIGKRTEHDDQPYCSDIFDKHVEIDQTIAINETTKEKSYIPKAEAQTSIIFEIYASTQKSPMYVTDEGCMKLGSVSVDNIVQSVPKNQRTAFFSMTFGGTEIEATAREGITGKSTKSTVNFLG